MNSDVPFGAWLKQHRRALDLSREHLAGQIGCSISLLEKIETGERRPSRTMAERFALCLSIPAEQRDAFRAAARAGRAPHDVGQVPTRTAPTTAAPPRTSRLPAPMTSFIGRAWEIATVAARLRTPDVRLVTLTGAGGVGKTRLALQIGSALHDAFPHGVWFVNLAPISDPALVISTIAQTLGVREQLGISATETLRAALRDQQLLVLLDNFEQVVAAAPELALLLAELPGMKLLVTSREALRLYGEHIVVVAPLAVPTTDDGRQTTDDGRPTTPDGQAPVVGGRRSSVTDGPAPVVAGQLSVVMQYAAAQLFVARAQAASADFRLTDANAPVVAAICARLDGLPLAIELAAAQIPLFPPPALLTRLEQRLPMLTRGPRDVPTRQQTLHDTIDWSYDLLTSAEQTLFRRLSMFVGGYTLEAAEAVCADRETERPGDREPEQIHTYSVSPNLSVSVSVLDGLAALMDKSLLRREEGLDGEPRFTMLETIREYALERLSERGERAEIQRRHAEYFLVVAEDAESQLFGAAQRMWLHRLETEHDNLRATLAWSLSTRGDAALGLRLAGAIWHFWNMYGYTSEGRVWLEGALELSKAAVLPPTAAARAKALGGLGFIMRLLGDWGPASLLIEESLSLYREMRDHDGMANALVDLGRMARDAGNYPRAQTLEEEGLAIFMEHETAWGISWALISLGDVALDQGDSARATGLFQNALDLFRQEGNRLMSGWALISLGRIAYAQGDLMRAMPLFAENLALFRSLNYHDGVAQVLVDLARAAHVQGDDMQATERFAESLALTRGTGNLRNTANCLEGLAEVAAASDQLKRAARLFGSAESLRESTGIPLPPLLRTNYERNVTAIRAQLKDDAFAAAWASGRALTLEQAIADALAPS